MGRTTVHALAGELGITVSQLLRRLDALGERRAPSVASAVSEAAARLLRAEFSRHAEDAAALRRQLPEPPSRALSDPGGASRALAAEIFEKPARTLLPAQRPGRGRSPSTAGGGSRSYSDWDYYLITPEERSAWEQAGVDNPRLACELAVARIWPERLSRKLQGVPVIERLLAGESVAMILRRARSVAAAKTQPTVEAEPPPRLES
jgi:hypothetical protein